MQGKGAMLLESYRKLKAQDFVLMLGGKYCELFEDELLQY